MKGVDDTQKKYILGGEDTAQKTLIMGEGHCTYFLNGGGQLGLGKNIYWGTPHILIGGSNRGGDTT